MSEQDRPLTQAELPDDVAQLDVAPVLVQAHLSKASAEHLRYIVDQVYFAGDERRERLRRFAILIVLSTSIAAFGLLADSVAVVIGAMLVAPLMTPIMGLAVSIVLTESRRLVASGLTVAGGAGGAIAVGWGIALIAGGGLTATSLPGEVLSRTSPGMLDLGVAVAAGLTGGYLLVDQKAAASAAGVAIAVALVPPLATVGICLQVGAWGEAAGALLLFGTNLVAIVLSAALVILVSRIVPTGFMRARFRELRLGLAAVLVAVIVVAIPLGIHTGRVVEKSQFERLVADTVEDWDARSAIVQLQTEIGEVWQVDLRLLVPADRSPTWLLAQLISERTGRAIDLDLDAGVQARERASSR